jgi:hypothetical protein
VTKKKLSLRVSRETSVLPKTTKIPSTTTLQKRTPRKESVKENGQGI